MRQESALIEALQCCHLAAELPGDPERDILMHLALEFHRLAEKKRVKAKGSRPENDEESGYYARRAAQHTQAAVLAPDPAVKTIHYDLAVRYFELIELKHASNARRIFA